MMCVSSAVRAAALIVSPWRTATVRAVVFPMAPGDDARGIRDDGAVVEENVDVILRRQQGGDVALQHNGGTGGALDSLGDLGVGGMDQSADLVCSLREIRPFDTITDGHAGAPFPMLMS